MKSCKNCKSNDKLKPQNEHISSLPLLVIWSLYFNASFYDQVKKITYNVKAC